MVVTQDAPVRSLFRQLLSSSNQVSLTLEEWAAVLPVLHTHRLAGFVYTRVRQTSSWRTLPDSVQQALSTEFQDLSVRAYWLEAELANIVATLASKNIEVILLKGAALGRTLYNNLVERPINDFDLFVRRQHVNQAQQALTDLGYYNPQKKSLAWLADWQRYYEAELPLIRPSENAGLHVLELHWALLEAPYYIDLIPVEEIWQHARPAPALPYALVPDLSTLLIHACAHLALHHSDDQLLFWLLDIDRMLRSPEFDWPATFERAQRWQLDMALVRIIQQAIEILETPLPAEISQQLAIYQPSARQQALWGIGDAQPHRNFHKARITWQAASPAFRLRYTGWLALRGLLWGPKRVVQHWN